MPEEHFQEIKNMVNENHNVEHNVQITVVEGSRAKRNLKTSKEVAARIEIGEWIEANMLNGPKDNTYTALFPYMVKRLKQGKRL